MELPSVSAIVAVYNYERYLPETLESALRQEYPPELLEIVIVDDGSTDGTPEVIAEFAARHPGRIRAFRQENAGYVAASNRAFAAARGQFWALLDADDLWPPEKTRLQVEMFAANGRLGAAYGDLRVIDEAGATLRPSHWLADSVTPLRGAGALVPLLAGGNVAGASSIMVRAALAERFAPVPATVPYVDWWLMMRIAAVAEIDFRWEPRVGYRVHGRNLTMGAEGEQLARERVKQAQTRRAMILRGAGAVLPAEALAATWEGVERDRFGAVRAGGEQWGQLPEDPNEHARALQHAQRAQRLLRRGRPVEALRTWLLVAALMPNEELVVESVRSLGQMLANRAAADGAEGAADPFIGARSFVVFAELAELAEQPAALAAFAGSFGAEERATLFIHAEGLEAAELQRRLTTIFARAGVALDCPAHVVALTFSEGEASGERLRALADVASPGADRALLRERYEQAIAPLCCLELGAP